MGSPSYLDRIAWREGKPQHYSEPKLILDLSHWKHNASCLPAQPVGGSVKDLGETKQEEQAEEEEREEEDTGDLFQEISRWVESTQSRLHSPGTSPFLEASSPSGYTSSPPLPLSPSDLPTFIFHYTELVQQPSSRYDADRHSPLPPATSSFTSLPSLFPSSPTSPLPTESPRTSPALAPDQESKPPSSTSSTVRPAGDAAVQPLPVKPKDRLFDLDVFISRALKLCRQNKDRGDEKRGKEGGWRQESKQQNIS